MCVSGCTSQLFVLILKFWMWFWMILWLELHPLPLVHRKWLWSNLEYIKYLIFQNFTHFKCKSLRFARMFCLWARTEYSDFSPKYWKEWRESSAGDTRVGRCSRCCRVVVVVGELLGQILLLVCTAPETQLSRKCDYEKLVPLSP